MLIYTASIKLKQPPEEIEHTFDLSEVAVDINFSLSESALDDSIRDTIMSKPKFQKLLASYVKKIESADFNVVLITCAHGLHRSVAMAESIKSKYPLSQCVHLMLK